MYAFSIIGRGMSRGCGAARLIRHQVRMFLDVKHSVSMMFTMLLAMFWSLDKAAHYVTVSRGVND